MLYNVQDLAKRSKSKGITKQASLLEFAQIHKSFNKLKTYDIFLSHSFLDAEYIKIIKDDLEELGLTVYVDWIEDGQLNRENVTRETADTLRQRMRQCKTLFYVTTENYQKSKWMQWELGYFDALKEKVAILPVVSTPKGNDEYTGTEYLGLYYYVSINKTKGTNETTIYINRSNSEYTTFKEWILGGEPRLVP